jgi:tetratricopeptide (TPR) repeat protein
MPGVSSTTASRLEHSAALLAARQLRLALHEAELALAALEVDTDARLSADAHEIAGSAALGLGRYPVAEEHLRQAAMLLHDQGEEQRALSSQLRLAEALFRQGNLLSARHLAQLALDKSRAENWLELTARSLMCLGNLAWAEGIVQDAHDLLSEATQVYDGLQLASEAARARCALAVAYAMAGETEIATSLLQQALLQFQHDRDYMQIARCLNNLAGIHFQNQDYSRAREYLLQCVDLEAEQGARSDMASAWFNLSLIELGEKNIKLARKYLHRTLQLAHETGDRNREGAALLHLGIVALLEDEAAEAQNFIDLAASAFQGSPSQHARTFRIYQAVFHLAAGRIEKAVQTWNLPTGGRGIVEIEKRTLAALLAHLANTYKDEDTALLEKVRQHARSWVEELLA